MTTWSRVTVQIVTHHSRAWAQPLSVALTEAEHIVVADNASTDGSAEAFAEALPQAKIVKLPRNSGFGVAHNAAAEMGRGEFILLLNPDCSIDEPVLSQLQKVLDENSTVGAVSPQLVNADRSLQVTARNAFFKSPRRVLTEAGPVEWLSGACLLVRRTAWHAVGGFDPRYFLFFEDDDLCLRLQRANWQCWFVPSAVAVHHAGTGSAFSWSVWWLKNFHQARSKRLALRTWVGPWAAWRYRFELLLGSLFAVVLYLLILRPRHAVKWAAWGASALLAD